MRKEVCMRGEIIVAAFPFVSQGYKFNNTQLSLTLALEFNAMCKNRSVVLKSEEWDDLRGSREVGFVKDFTDDDKVIVGCYGKHMEHIQSLWDMDYGWGGIDDFLMCPKMYCDFDRVDGSKIITNIINLDLYLLTARQFMNHQNFAAINGSPGEFASDFNSDQYSFNVYAFGSEL